MAMEDAATVMWSKWKVIENLVPAEHLRRYADISKVKSEKKVNVKDEGQDAFEEQKKLFLQSEFLERDLEILGLKVIDAAKRGKYEVEVMKFPAAYCTDEGRAINNSEKDWPDTLQGKAKSFFDIWKEHGQPYGYRLKVRINDYPGGFIGSVSLLINWS